MSEVKLAIPGIKSRVPELIGSTFFGSCTTGLDEPNSDLDMCILYNDSRGEFVRKQQQNKFSINWFTDPAAIQATCTDTSVENTLIDEFVNITKSNGTVGKIDSSGIVCIPAGEFTTELVARKFRSDMQHCLNFLSPDHYLNILSMFFLASNKGVMENRRIILDIFAKFKDRDGMVQKLMTLLNDWEGNRYQLDGKTRKGRIYTRRVHKNNTSSILPRTISEAREYFLRGLK
jgi:hypothetical protein